MNKERIRQYRQGLGDWLNRFTWDWWGTFTFRKPKGPDTAKRAFEKFISELFKGSKFYMAMEYPNRSQRIHIHAIIRDDNILSTKKKLEKIWKDKYGKVEIEKYDSKRGAVYYISKFAASDKVEGHFNLEPGDEKERHTRKIKLGEPLPRI